MAKTDPILGAQVRDHLRSLGLETLMTDHHPRIGAAQDALAEGVHRFLGHMNLDVVTDPSIVDTPRRIAEMFSIELCAGLNYDNFPKCTTTPNGTTTYPGFEEYVDKRVAAWASTESPKTRVEVLSMEGNQVTKQNMAVTVGRVDEMVLVRNIRTTSLCEHHFQTISGVTHIAYIPNNTLLGLSKFARVVDFFARRPQVQERMTEQLFAALSFILGTADIAVKQECVHNCMRARGAMDPSSDTSTSKMGGRFMSNPSLRNEFLQGLGK